MDVHKNESQICMLTEQGEIVEQRILTRRDRLAAVFADRSPARVLIEASTESEWVARCLEEQGHEVVVADPNYAPMYATRSRRVKTDRRDAQALMDACRLGAYRPAHRTSETQRRVRALLAVRENLVRCRTRQIHVARSTPSLSAWVRPNDRTGCAAPPLRWRPYSRRPRDRSLDRAILEVVEQDPVIQRLRTVPGVGPITATAFVASIDQVERFRCAHEVESYLGLVPSEQSSGERRQRGAVTKAGNARVRYLLVEAAWCILRCRHSSTEKLREWAGRIALRRGRRVAVVALARRLAGILYAMWRDNTDYQAHPRRAPSGTAAPVSAT